MIYMRGVKSEEMSAIMDFLYHGEASVFQENLETFLAVAEELKLNGLTKEVKNKDGVENRIRRPSQKRKSKNELLFDPP